jgi:hypothetical protein
MKFTIRHLFLVTLIVAVVLGWVVDRSKLHDLLRRERRGFVERWHQLEQAAERDFEQKVAERI